MKKLTAIFILPGILLICLIGAFANYVGWERVDRWCERQLTDSPVADN